MIQEVGIHKVKCGDIMQGIDDLMVGEKADLIYSDPPWGQGNLRYWQTINKRHTGQEPKDIKYEKFLPFFFKLVSKFSRDIVVIEYGVRWRDDVIKLANQNGFKSGGVCTSLYSSKLLPLDVHLFSKSGKAKMTDVFKKGCFENKGFNLVDFIFSQILPQNSKIVLDPMCGMGYTAIASKKYNLAFRGNELNQKRLDKTIKALSK